jgi:hypothetical protein
VAGLTLDTGALIAYERGGREIAARLKYAGRRGTRITVPAPCIVEAWRGGPRSARIARLLAGANVEVLGLQLARVAGVLLGRTGTDDPVDAVVVAGARIRGDAILTGDPDDLGRLADAAGGRVTILAL